MNPTSLELLGTIFFAVAMVHTFSVKLFQKLGDRFEKGSALNNFFHFLGEVEVIFGFWAALLLSWVALSHGPEKAIEWVEQSDFTEPAFVFVIMAVAATRPILDLANTLIEGASRLIPLPREVSFYFSTLLLGPLLGSLITEPAAMTVTALILRDRFYKRKPPTRLMYLTLGTLFVNVSIGGALTPFAAPPILMVAKTWNWDLNYVLGHFGWKACIAATINSAIATAMSFYFLKSLKNSSARTTKSQASPWGVRAIHALTLFLIVATSHHSQIFIGIFLLFVGFVAITEKHQEELRLKQSLLVAFFLGGLVLFGNLQSWWLEPLLQRLDSLSLFLGATGLTAFTDNAALTYLGSKIPNLPESLKYSLVAGAITGGGLTVIANAPNPAGYSILKENFGETGIAPLALFLGALIPTGTALACFWFL